MYEEEGERSQEQSGSDTLSLSPRDPRLWKQGACAILRLSPREPNRLSVHSVSEIEGCHNPGWQAFKIILFLNCEVAKNIFYKK